MHQQPSADEIGQLLEHLNYPSQADIMQQKLFFIQTETIRQQRINDERIVEALIGIAANNPSLAARKEANKTLKYLGISPPPIEPELALSNQRENFRMGAMTGSATLFTISVIAQIVLLGEGWYRLLIFTVIGALIFGIPAGGFGGLILVKMRKTRNAAYIGGAIAGVILVPILYTIFLLWLFLVLGCC